MILINKSNEKMHAACYRARMTEETFQILFDVMERHFAALSLPDPASDPKITRAISFSELPSSRRILIEQCYQTDDSGHLVRQYSCEQVFDKSSNTREVKVSEIVRSSSERCLTNTWKTTLPVFGTLGNVGWHTSQYGSKIKAPKSSSSKNMESMEIEEIDIKPFKRPYARQKSKNVPIIELNGMSLADGQPSEKPLIRASTFGMSSTSNEVPMAKPTVRSRSASPKKITDRPIFTDSPSVEAPKNEENIVQKSDYNDLKKKLRSLVPEESKSSKKSRCSCSCYKFLFFVLLTLTAATLAILIHDVDQTMNERGFDFTNMTVELRENVYGQKSAVEELIRDLRKSASGINLVALVGGTGVGKSYAVGIVRKHFPHGDHVFEYFSPLRKTVHEAFESLSQRHCNLIILENLKKADLRDVVNFVKFTREQTNQYCIYAIAIFNPQETDATLVRKLDLQKNVDEIKSELRQKNLGDTKVIAFPTLDDRSLDACVRQAAKEKKVNLSDAQLSEIRETLISANSGCKGAYAKVQLLTNT